MKSVRRKRKEIRKSMNFRGEGKTFVRDFHGMKNVLFWVMTPGNLVGGYQCFRGIFYPEDGGSMFFRNNHIHVSDYTVA